MLCETPRSREDEQFRTQEHMQDFLDGVAIEEEDCYPHAEYMQSDPLDYMYEAIDLNTYKNCEVQTDGKEMENH